MPSHEFIWQETKADRINAVLNDPAVRPFVADESAGVLDMSTLVANPRNILLMGQWGGCFCLYLMPGVYEVHTQILPEGRGEWALNFVRAGSHWMFTRTDTYEIITRVPRTHIAARNLTVRAGMRFEFTRPNGCKYRERLMDADIYSFRVQDWMSEAPGLVERGLWFHDRLADEAQRCGITQPIHPDDPNHNRYVGAAYDMIRGGQPAKGVMLYNRWALCARHPIIRLVQSDPVLVEFDIGYLSLTDDGIALRLPNTARPNTAQGVAA